MLYRHFPKIANSKISIITAALSPGKDDETTTRQALEAFGVNLAYLGAERATPVPTGLPVPAVVALAAETVASEGALREALVARCARPGDYLAADFTGIPEESLAGMSKAVAAAAGAAVAGGILAGFGFRCGTDRAGLDSAARTVAEADGGWAFWCADYNLVTAPALEPTVRELGEEGIPLLATDPFAGGVLSAVPAQVHELYHSAPVPRAHEEWALRAIWESQYVASVAVPPSRPEAFATRCIFADAGRANSLPESELAVIRAAGSKLLT